MKFYDIFWKYILVVSSIGFLIPLIFTTIPYFIMLFFTVSFVSAMFWVDNTENSVVHYMDAAMARIGIISVLLYKIFINTNNLWLFSIFTAISFVMIYKSNVESRKKWASKTHILFHLFSHISLILSCIVAFMSPFTIIL
jgi:hypothetical protein